MQNYELFCNIYVYLFGNMQKIGFSKKILIL